MGGNGSGQWYRWDKKTTLEVCRCLDINRMVKLGSIQPDTMRSGSWVWTNAQTGEQTSSLGYTSSTSNPDNMFLQLRYVTSHDKNAYDYKIKIERTPLHFGGYRYWFICPYTRKRVAKLYKPYGAEKYASRHAFSLSYASQSEAAHDRALRKKWKLVNKLGGDQYHPIRPKGMHHKTYERLLDKFWQIEEECDAHLAGMLMKLGCRL